MLPSRLAARTPSAKAEGVGYVEGHRLMFEKLSRDGSGKADIRAAGHASDRVYGVLFRIDVGDEGALDRAEGLDKGYRKDTVRVVTQAGTVVAKTYVPTETKPSCIPYHWYKAFVVAGAVAGAVEHGLPPAYIECLWTIASQPDPKSERQTKNEALLFSECFCSASRARYCNRVLTPAFVVRPHLLTKWSLLTGNNGSYPTKSFSFFYGSVRLGVAIVRKPRPQRLAGRVFN